MDNILIIDWLSITSKEINVLEFKTLLGMADFPWEITRGSKGYTERVYFNGISIHYNGRDDMGVWMEMSGQGCRCFEDLGTGDFESLFNVVRDGHGSITRLDIAFDDHTGILDMSTLVDDTLAGKYVSKSKKWEVSVGSSGRTVYHGSMSSDILIRIYDKAAERHCPEGTHWIRVEMQLRRERALSYISLPGSPGDNFAGVLSNYLRYVVPEDSDSNRWRWSLTEYWANLLCDASPISLYVKPGLEYNLSRCEDFVYRQAGGAVDALIQIYGMQNFMRKLGEAKHGKITNPKYTQLIHSSRLALYGPVTDEELSMK